MTFTDYIPDPIDPVCIRRAITVRAEKITFNGEHAVLWLAGIEVERYPMDVITSIGVLAAPKIAERTDPATFRARYPNPYTTWSDEDEARLMTMHRDDGVQNLNALGTPRPATTLSVATVHTV